MPEIFKPNLAGTPKNDSEVPLPCYASPKIDGIRAMVHEVEHGKRPVVLSRSMKPIPNDWVQAVLQHPELVGLDGELVVGSPTDPNCMQNTTSGVMSIGKIPEFTFLVFDTVLLPESPYAVRLSHISKQVEAIQKRWVTIATSIRLDGGPMLTCPVVLVPQTVILAHEKLAEFEAECLEAGYEGVMVRGFDSMYKQGRSTVKERGLLKLKRFVDGEFIITGFEEQMKNNNAKTTNELGRSKRSSHASGKSGKDTLGALQVRHITAWEKADGVVGKQPTLGAIFNIGTGMDDELRAHIWANQKKYMNAVGTYKSFPVGVKDAPRHPVFKSFRPEWDIS